MRSPGQFEQFRSSRAPKTEVATAALAHRRRAAHNVSLDLKNPYNVFRDAWRARNDFGFLRNVEHPPSQVQPIVDAMKPDLGEVADAAEILLARNARTGGRSSTRASCTTAPRIDISGSFSRRRKSPAWLCPKTLPLLSSEMTTALKAPMNADKCTPIAANECRLSARIVIALCRSPLRDRVG